MSEPTSSEEVDRIAAALGASRRAPLSGQSAQGALGLLGLRAEVERRVRSSGGRPPDPPWTVRRMVPFRSDGWTEREPFAARLTASGLSASPAQLPAILIERGRASLEDGVERDGDISRQRMVGG